MTVVPLHVHSEYSSLDGWSEMEEIARRADEIGAPAVGLTDHGVVAGHLKFAKALEKVGVNPVFGSELYMGTKTEGFEKKRDQSHLIALAMTDRGLRNLWALDSCAADEDHYYYVGRVFKEDIAKYKEGIVFTSACALGLVPKGLMADDYAWLNWYLDTLGDDFYIELSTYPADKPFEDRDGGEPTSTRIINEALVSVGLERGCQFVYGDDSHYAFPEHFHEHDIYLARQTGQTIFTPVEDRKMWHPPGALAMKDEETVREALSYLPASVVDNCVANSVALGERAQAQLPEVRRHLPVFVPGDCPFLDDEWRKLTADELFLRLVVDGIFDRYGEHPSVEVWERVSYECETLIRDGIHHYFLMGWDEIMFCDKEGISRGPGRGSSAGCIVAYALKITDVDPLHYGLIFERFWNSGRTDGFPDIDSDFPQSARQRVIDYLKDRWGQEHVCAIGTVGRMKPKKVCENMAKAFGITDAELIVIKSIVGKTTDIEILGIDQIGWSREREPGKVSYVDEDCGDEIAEWIGDLTPDDNGFVKLGARTRKEYIDMCRQACSRVHLYGIHPSGIVISDVQLNDELPAALRGSKADGRKAATQFPMDDVDSRYFVKLDVLGLRTLDTLDHWEVMMAEEGVEVEFSGLDLKPQEPEMWDMLQNGFAAGVFQVESGYPRSLCERMNARSVEDLAVIVALNRPGPIGDKIPDRYIARRSGDEEVTYAHARLKEILHPWLAPTQGLFVYQEQVINFFNSIGYTLHESDAVRKILGKKKPEKLTALYDGTEEWKGRGYLQMAEAAGIPTKHADDTWGGLERFAAYSFNKSHAVAYGIIGFRCVYAKYWGGPQFYASCTRTAENEKRKEMLPLYVNEARRLGLEFFPPDIELSQGWASVFDSTEIYMGFGDVKGVGNSGDYMAKLRDELPHDTVEDFYEAFEVMSDEYLAQKKSRTKLLAKGEDVSHIVLPEKSPKQLLGKNKIENIYRSGAWDRYMETPDISMAVRQELEEELLGVILTDTSAAAFATNSDEVQECAQDWPQLKLSYGEKIDPDDPADAFVYRVPGVVSMVEERRGRASGKSYGLITITFDQYEQSFVAHNSQWKSHKFLFRMRTPGVFQIKQGPPTEFADVYSYQFTKGHALQP